MNDVTDGARATPTVSVLMPVYNAASFLHSAIVAVLGQSYSAIELVIVDDGSTDSSAELIRTFADDVRIHTVRQKHGGAASARNTALRCSKGEIVAMMDADDLCAPDRIARQVELLRSDADLVAVGCNARYVTESGEYLYSTELPVGHAAIVREFPRVAMIGASLMLRRRDAERLGGYVESLGSYGEDLDLLHRLADVGKLANVDQPLYTVRIQPNSVGMQVSRAEEHAFLRWIAGRARSGDASAPPAVAPKPVQWRTAAYFNRLGNAYLLQGAGRKRALVCFVRSLAQQPLSLRLWGNVAASLLPRRFSSWVKSTRGSSQRSLS